MKLRKILYSTVFGTVSSRVRAHVKLILATLIAAMVTVGLGPGFLSSAPNEPAAITSPQEQAVSLFVIQLEGQWGYINRTGEIIIPPQFESADRFCEGLAAVKMGEKYGYIDSSGQFVIRPQFQNATCFSDSLAAVSNNGHDYGYIDQTGEMIISPQFTWALPFENGVAYVNGQAYINRSGETIVQRGDFETMPHFQEGLAVIKQGNKYGYIDSSGSIVVPPTFDWAHDFQDGLAQARVDGKYGYIDHTGTFVIGPKFDGAWDFHEGLANVTVGDQKGVINRQGVYVFGPRPIPPNFSGFSEGLAAVQGADSRWGYMDLTGNTVIQPQFTRADPFQDGLAKIKTDEFWGYIDRTGNIVIEPQFNEGDYIAEYQNGLIAVRKGRLGEDGLFDWSRGYLNRYGDYVWPLSE